MATNKSNQETTETDSIPVTTETDNVPVTTEQEVPTTVIPELNTLEEKVEAYYKYTSLKLDYNCHMDMEFVELWYQTKYLTGKVYKWAMKPGTRIVHYVDGTIYKAANMTDEIAERLMQENPAYAEQFINLMEK